MVYYMKLAQTDGGREKRRVLLNKGYYINKGDLTITNIP